MPDAPRVAVITAAYNAERFIDATIRSVRTQTFPHFEYVIVDDNSTDATADVIAAHVHQDSRVRMLRHSVNTGPGAARNRGVAATTAPFISFIDSDDCWEPAFIRVMLAALVRQAPHCVGVFCRSIVVDEHGTPTGMIQGPSDGSYRFFDFFRHIFPPGNGSAFLLHRRYFEESGGFSDLRSLEDLELYLRILRSGKERHFASVGHTLVRYRQSSTGLSANGHHIASAWQSTMERYVESLPPHQRWIIYYNFSCFYGPRPCDTADLGTRLMRRALLSRKAPGEVFRHLGSMLLPATMGWKRYLALRRSLKRVGAFGR